MSAMTVTTLVLPSRPQLRLVPTGETSRRRAVRPAPARVVVPSVVTSSAAQAVPTAGLRLTRRGRLAVTLLVAALAVVTAVVGARGAWAGSDVRAPAPTAEVLVLPGQTLWQIAEDVDPRADPRDVIAEIRQLNGLPTSSVQAGQTLVVPAG